MKKKKKKKKKKKRHRGRLLVSGLPISFGKKVKNAVALIEDSR
jgi:hypothetical protein